MPDALRGLRNVRFVVYTLLWGFALGPAVTYAITRVVPLEPACATGLLLLGMTPCAPFLPAIVSKAKGACASRFTPPQRAYNFGARPQRLLWVSTGTKDPLASEVLYVKALAAPLTVNTMPEATLKALATHTELGRLMATDGGDCESVLGDFAKAGVDVDPLSARLQDEGAKSFVASWNELMAVISSKGAARR